jgi:hypothetical protein
MDMQEAAAALHGNEYAREGSMELFAAMKDAGLVAAFGASDDLTEFRGAIDDEAGAGDETEHYLTRKGFPRNECDEDDCPYFRKLLAGMTPAVVARWCPNGFPGSWLIETPLPHATFDIMEDGEVYCRGVVFSVSDLPAGLPA